MWAYIVTFSKNNIFAFLKTDAEAISINDLSHKTKFQKGKLLRCSPTL